MSDDIHDNNPDVGHKLFWAAWHMPYEKFEEQGELEKRMTAVQELLAQNLAERMIKSNSVDMVLEVKTNEDEEEIYEFTAKCVITNPNMVIAQDLQTFNRIKDYADYTEFKSEEERDNFYAVLERMQPPPITIN